MRVLLFLLLAASPCAAQTWAAEFCNPATTDQRRYEIAPKIIEAKQPEEFISRLGEANPPEVRLLAARGLGMYHAGHFDELEKLRERPDGVELLAVAMRQPSPFTLIQAGEILAKEEPYSPRWNWVVDAFKQSHDGTARALPMFRGWLDNKERQPAAIRVLKAFFATDEENPAKLKRAVDSALREPGSLGPSATARVPRVVLEPYSFKGETLVLQPGAAAFEPLEDDGKEDFSAAVAVKSLTDAKFCISLVVDVGGEERWWKMQRDGEFLVLDTGSPTAPRMAGKLSAVANGVEFRLVMLAGERLLAVLMNGRSIIGMQRLVVGGRGLRLEINAQEATVAIGGVRTGKAEARPDFERPR